MKRLFLVVMTLMMCLSLCACGTSQNTKNIDVALQGEWYYIMDFFELYYSFSDGEYEYAFFSSLLETPTYHSGSYTIKNDVIVTQSEDGLDNDEIPYTYNKDSGKLRLFWDDDKSLELKRAE